MDLLKIHSLHSYFQEYHLDYNHKCISSLHFFFTGAVPDHSDGAGLHIHPGPYVDR